MTPPGRMLQLWYKVRAARSLGWPNVLRILWYRSSVVLRFNPAIHLRASAPDGPFFEILEDGELKAPSGADEPAGIRYFGWFEDKLQGEVPDWFLNPFSGVRHPGASRPWWQLPDFEPSAGDIKAIWEPSRWGWLMPLAVEASKGRRASARLLNQWLRDWCELNSPYAGPNWKCGQEASIRVIHLALAAELLRQVSQPTRSVLDLVRIHLRRIEPTLVYAMAQDNNHATSEAAALFIGGSWLEMTAGDRSAERWQRRGRHLLERSVRRLVARDGTFSQYSIAYHRLLIDTLTAVEIWRRRVGADPFSGEFYSRAEAALGWLGAFIDPDTGAVPNTGANDSTWLIPLGAPGPLDFRPSAQLAAATFLGSCLYPEGPWDEPAECFGLTSDAVCEPAKGSFVFDDGGFAVLRSGDARVFVRFPRHRFRPSHADALHVDLWVGAENILRDAGTFSYAAAPEEQASFAGTAGHNTVQLDDRDQMPRLGRFLFGEWTQAAHAEHRAAADGCESFFATYRDWAGGEHHRRVDLSRQQMVVEDRVSGFRRNAVLRWRLAPGPWRIDDNRWSNGRFSIDVVLDPAVETRRELVEGWESLHYLQKSLIPVIEVESRERCTFKTTITWD